jgi:hypothetical protein
LNEKNSEPDPEPIESFQPITMRLPKKNTFVVPTPNLEVLLEKDFPREE